MNREDSKPCVFFVSNRFFALVNSRLLIIEHFLSRGWRVVAAAAPDKYAEKLTSLGVIVEPVSFVRKTLTPGNDFRATLKLRQLYRKYKPILINHFNTKPIILGTLASYSLPSAHVVNIVTGSGYLFSGNRLLRYLISSMLTVLMKRCGAAVFQNADDLEFFLGQRWVTESKTKLIISSGVDLSRFRPAEAADNNPGIKVIMVSRLLRSKGVLEFAEAAEICHKQFSTAKFILAGEWDLHNPDSIDPSWFQQETAKRNLEFIGFIDKIENFLRSADIFVLPSYYREGVPRVLLEAAASGIPVITTDTPGCREAVVDGKTGLLIPPRDSTSLAEAISYLITNPGLRAEMGLAGRKFIEESYDIKVVARKYLELYRDLNLNIAE